MKHASIAILAACVAGGCTTIDQYRYTDALPGQAVSGTSPFSRTMDALNPFSGGYNDTWTRIRVIAPPGADACRIAGQSIFISDGPSPKGKPDEKREVMLAYDEGAKSASFECRTPAGVVKRKVEASVYTMPIPANVPADKMWLYKGDRSWRVLPPLVHMDPADPDAEARWAAISIELCSPGSKAQYSLMCRPGMLEKLKAADLGEGS
jgi:hypothetical protein